MKQSDARMLGLLLYTYGTALMYGMRTLDFIGKGMYPAASVNARGAAHWANHYQRLLEDMIS